MGLKESEHIGRIVIDPRNSDVVYVAAQGPLWRKGGDRGVYKTTDGGKTWTKVLERRRLDRRERHPARSAQSRRARRHDVAARATHVRLHRRRPRVRRSTARPTPERRGPNRSRDSRSTISAASGSRCHRPIRASSTRSPRRRTTKADSSVRATAARAGRRWAARRSGGNYYNRIFADPKNVDRVYAVDVNLQVTDDGGKTFHRVGEQLKHVDNHVGRGSTRTTPTT